MPRSTPPSPPPDPPAPARRPAPPPSPPRSFAAVVNLWPCAGALAAILDVEAVTVRAWRRRGIPARYWAGVAAAARFTGRPVDERLLAELGAIQKGRSHG